MNSQELRALQEAYSQVYELDEASVTDDRVRRNQKQFGSNYTPPRDFDQSANRGQGAVLNAKQKEKQRRKKIAKGAMGEAVDLYDIILSHLIDEGYADTFEAAEAIMVNMSEDWRESIVEEVLDEGQKKYPEEKVENAGNKKVRTLQDPNISPEKKLRTAIQLDTIGKSYMAHLTNRPQPVPPKRRAGTYKESFNIFVNSMIAEGVSMERYTWEEIQNVFDDLFEAQVANRNPDEYERKAKQGQSREQQLKGRVMGRMNQMDPDKKAAMLKQMRAAGLDV